MNQSEVFMKEALKLAKIAGSLGEVPVGAVVVLSEKIIGTGWNRRELMASAIEHAEINALREASAHTSAWRLNEATVYSTLEPCIMCTGALIHARVKRLVYGAADPKFGAIESLFKLATDVRLNHRFLAEGGVMEKESSRLLKEFFRNVRDQKS